MDQDREEQHRRLTEPHKSQATKLAWKRHHNNYMQGMRKRSREEMNKSFYDVAKELEECLKLHEAKVKKDDIFDLNCELVFDNISGGISFTIDPETGSVSFSTSLDEQGHGAYRLENMPQSQDEFKSLYNDLKDELSTLATTIDDNMKQISAKHGLRES